MCPKCDTIRGIKRRFHQLSEEKEVITEEEVLETLVEPSKQQPLGEGTFVYSQNIGCFDVKSIFINLIVYIIVLMVVSGLIDGFQVTGISGAIQTAVVMCILNVVLKPIIVILTLPLTILTFGLFYVLVNGFLLVIADNLMGLTFEIHSFTTAVIAAIFISLLRMGINHYVLKNDSLKIM